MVHKHFESLALVTLVLATWPLNSATSQPPAEMALSPSPDRGVQPIATASQPCVLLRNDNVLFGRARQVGEYVVVQTGQDGRVQLSRTEVACWADSTRDLYQYRVDHRQTGDPAAHLRDARWCLRYDLYDLAAQEIRAIHRIDPGNIEAKRIADQLKRLTSPRSSVHANGIGQASPVSHAGYEDPAPDLGSVDLATLRGFASHVQPILLNRCAGCHSSKSTDVSGWSLAAPPAGARASSRMTRENLAATLPFIDHAAPEDCELLVKATTPHGGSDAPLDPRSSRAIESLKNWILLAGRAAAPKSGSARLGAARPNVTDGLPVETPVIAERPMVSSPSPRSTAPSRTPARLPQVTNPFDPELFNRRFHSE